MPINLIEPVSTNLRFKMSLAIERAIPSHAQQLSELAFRSKAYWGYSDDFMQDCREELSYSEKELSDHHAYVLKTSDQIIGFIS